MIINRVYIIGALAAFGLLKALVASLSLYAYSSGKVSYFLNETIIFGILGVLLVLGALNIKRVWGKALAVLFFAFLAIKQVALLLTGFNIQWLIVLFTGREVTGSPYWYINLLYIAAYIFICFGLWFSNERNAQEG